MAFVVEDGTGLEDANSYCDVAFADEYFLDRGVSEWANASDDQKKQALVKAADYIDRAFSYKGHIYSDSQALVWPRITAFDSGPYLPTAVKKAASEYALISLSGELFSKPVYDASGKVVTGQTRKLSGMSTSIQFSEYKTVIKKDHPSADFLLEPFIKGGGPVQYITR